MSHKRALYLVPKTLDAPARILALPLDEFIPALLLGVFFFLSGQVVLSLIIATLAVIMIRLLKQGQGSAWLINVCHWYLPKVVMTHLLQKTPPSQNREYIA